MHQFTDSTGRAWRIAINRASVRKLWDLLKLNLHEPADVARLCNSERYLLLPQVLEVLCHDAAGAVWPEAAGKPADILDRFEELLTDDNWFDQAHKAVCEELADFFRGRGRQTLAAYLERAPHLIAKETQATQAALPDPATIERTLDERLASLRPNLPTPGTSSTTGPEKSESTPTP